MTVLQAVFLGLVQGLTEFLPVSSTGHLVFFQKILGFSQPPVAFDILVHVATLVAVLVFFAKELTRLCAATFKAILSLRLAEIPKEVPLLLVGTIPAVLAGLWLEQYLDLLFSSLALVGITWLMTAALMFAVSWLPDGKKKVSGITYGDALLIGVFQAIAILPAVSRSGATIFGALWRRLDKKSAFNFSFLLSIPAIAGAAVLEFKDFGQSLNGNLLSYVLGFAVAAVSGYIALILFRRSVIEGKLAYFGVYSLALGLISLGISFW